MRTPTEMSILCGIIVIILSFSVFMLVKPKFVLKKQLPKVDTGKVIFLSFLFGALAYVSSYLYLTRTKVVEQSSFP